eukprot:645038-Amphidinium_carterae.1
MIGRRALATRTLPDRIGSSSPPRTGREGTDCRLLCVCFSPLCSHTVPSRTGRRKVNFYFGFVRRPHLHPPRVGREKDWHIFFQLQLDPSRFQGYKVSRIGRRRACKALIRVGEATNPGPCSQERPGIEAPNEPRALKVLTVSAGGWAPALNSLCLQLYDVVFVQETWLMEGSKPSSRDTQGNSFPLRKPRRLGVAK